jgi:hypothetical protein
MYILMELSIALASHIISFPHSGVGTIYKQIRVKSDHLSRCSDFSQSTRTSTGLQSSPIVIGAPSCLSRPIKSLRLRPVLAEIAFRDTPEPVATKESYVPASQCNSSRISLGMTIWPLLDSLIVAIDMERSW